MKLILTLTGSATLAGLAVLSLCIAVAQIATEYIRMAAKVSFAGSAF